MAFYCILKSLDLPPRLNQIHFPPLMFNTTHTLAGIGIARTATEKWLRYATVTAVIAANLPDIDSVAGFWGTAPYLDHHRGITRSLIGIPILSLLLSAVMYYFTRFCPDVHRRTGCNGDTSGTRLLEPLWFAAVSSLERQVVLRRHVFIFDPYLDILLLLGVVYGSRWPKHRRFGAVLSLLLGITYIGARMELHSRAVAHTNAYFSNSSDRVP